MYQSYNLRKTNFGDTIDVQNGQKANLILFKSNVLYLKI